MSAALLIILRNAFEYRLDEMKLITIKDFPGHILRDCHSLDTMQ